MIKMKSILQTIEKTHDINKIFTDCHLSDDNLSELSKEINKSVKSKYISKKMARKSKYSMDTKTESKSSIVTDTNGLPSSTSPDSKHVTNNGTAKSSIDDNDQTVTHRSVDEQEAVPSRTAIYQGLDSTVNEPETTPAVTYKELDISNIDSPLVTLESPMTFSSPTSVVSVDVDKCFFFQTNSTNQSVKRLQEEKFWLEVIQKWNEKLRKNKNSIRKSIDNGVSDSVRGIVWSRMIARFSSSNKERYQSFSDKYPDLNDMNLFPIHSLNPLLVDKINEDVSKSFHIDMQESIKRVVTRYAVIDNEVGYCSGLNYIAAVFVNYLTEDSAFYAFAGLMNHVRGPLRQLYLSDGIKKSYVLTSKGRELFDKLYNHLTNLDIDSAQ